MGLSPYGCTRMVAELLLGHQTSWMLPRSFSAVLGDFRWAMWSTLGAKDVHCRVWVIGPHTHRAAEGGSYTSGGVPFRIIKSFFRAGFVAHPPQ